MRPGWGLNVYFSKFTMPPESKFTTAMSGDRKGEGALDSGGVKSLDDPALRSMVGPSTYVSPQLGKSVAFSSRILHCEGEERHTKIS